MSYSYWLAIFSC